jgi:DNA-directed RNA polymerase III subunit RPC8
MYIDTGEIVRVRVESDDFFDDEPGPPKATEGVMLTKTERRRPPYTITVSSKHPRAQAGISAHGMLTFCYFCADCLVILMQCSIGEQGLGPLPWWKSSQEEEAMDEG